MKPEAKIEDEVCKHAKLKGLIPIKMSVPGQRGWPDRQFLMGSGYTFFIEFKDVKGELSHHQKQRIATLKSMGFAIFVVDEIGYGKSIIDQEIRKLEVIKRMVRS